MQELPQAIFGANTKDIHVYPYSGDSPMSRNRVALQHNVISFIVQGHKRVNLAGSSIEANEEENLIMLQGNYLMTEQAPLAAPYRSMLLFFSKAALQDFLLSRQLCVPAERQQKRAPWFRFHKDAFIRSYIEALYALANMPAEQTQAILHTKVEEILLYLLQREGESFRLFLQSYAASQQELPLRSVVEKNKYNDLSVAELAFLCNMSISTFKRHFVQTYGEAPGRWFKRQKLLKAHDILASGQQRASEIHQRFGYDSLSNFSAAFKREFGISPQQLTIDPNS